MRCGKSGYIYVADTGKNEGDIIHSSLSVWAKSLSLFPELTNFKKMYQEDNGVCLIHSGHRQDDKVRSSRPLSDVKGCGLGGNVKILQ